ncbi:MAG: Mut7-C ubiquitin/RNAse domain-containing protein [Anaerolineales bacterium]|nr:Mut7-C ubiquitin/RNAse domain-containing protein [Anaerolineales bacterium]
MNSASFRFYAGLNDFLAPRQRGIRFSYSFWGNPAVKDAIEAIGVPHPEVELLLVNAESAGFEILLHDGDRISIFPRFQTLSVSDLSLVFPAHADNGRFVLDIHLGRLASFLRLLGFDVKYQNDASDADLARCSSEETRILLTRDRGLLKRSEVIYGYCVRHTDPTAQTVEILHRYNLWDNIKPFSRCTLCNGRILAVEREAVVDKILAGTRTVYSQFFQCEACGKIYWSGSHVREMRTWMERILRSRPIRDF